MEQYLQNESLNELYSHQNYLSERLRSNYPEVIDLPTMPLVDTCNSPSHMSPPSIEGDFDLASPPGLRRSSASSLASWATIDTNRNPATPGTDEGNCHPEYVSSQGKKRYEATDFLLQTVENSENYEPNSIAPNLLSLDRLSLDRTQLNMNPNTPSRPTNFRHLQILGNHHDNILKDEPRFSARIFGEENQCGDHEAGDSDYNSNKNYCSNYVEGRCGRRDTILPSSSPSVSLHTSPEDHHDGRMYCEPRTFTFPLSPPSSGSDTSGSSSNYGFAHQTFLPANPDTSPRDAALTALQCVMPGNSQGYCEEINMSDREDIPCSSPPHEIDSRQGRGAGSLIGPARVQKKKRKGPRKVNTVLPLVVSSTDKPYGCSNLGCDKRFKRQEHLKRHMYTHSGVRPYHCHLCGQKFSRTDNLKQHKTTHKNKRGRNLYIPDAE